MKAPSLQWLVLGSALIASYVPIAAARTTACPTRPNDQAAVTEAVRTLYAALTAEDTKTFRATIAPGFYMYDGGKRFHDDEIMTLVTAAHARGDRYQWTVTEPDVHIHCNDAWIAFVTQGLVRKADAPEVHVTWLESAVLRYQAGAWRLVFFHSTRVPEATTARPE